MIRKVHRYAVAVVLLRRRRASPSPQLDRTGSPERPESTDCSTTTVPSASRTSSASTSTGTEGGPRGPFGPEGLRGTAVPDEPHASPGPFGSSGGSCTGWGGGASPSPRRTPSSGSMSTARATGRLQPGRLERSRERVGRLRRSPLETARVPQARRGHDLRRAEQDRSAAPGAGQRTTRASGTDRAARTCGNVPTAGSSRPTTTPGATPRSSISSGRAKQPSGPGIVNG